MRQILISLVLTAATCGPAIAQTTPERPADQLAVVPVPKAKETSESDEIRSRIERVGYAHVTDLTRDSMGVWHAHAIRDDQPVSITVDKGGRIKPEAR
jgi:hypothetical protein